MYLVFSCIVWVKMSTSGKATASRWQLLNLFNLLLFKTGKVEKGCEAEY